MVDGSSFGGKELFPWILYYKNIKNVYILQRTLHSRECIE